MTLSPDEYSDLCFLPPAEQQRLEKLVRQMNAAETNFETLLRNGNMAVKAMSARKLKLPGRDPMESGSKYDKDIQNWARMLLENTDEVLQQKWENCTITSGYLAGSVAHQQEAEALLHIAYHTQPPYKSKSWQVAVNRSEAAHDLLNDLQTKLEDFKSAPVAARFERCDQRLANVSEPMATMKREHAKFVRHLDDMPAQEIHDETMDYVKKAGEYLKQLDQISETLGKASKLVPDLQDIASVYQPAISSERRTR